MRMVFGFIICVIFVGFVVSGCALVNPLKIVALAPAEPMPTAEGMSVTITAEVLRSGSGGGNVLTAEAIALIFKPKNFSILNDRMYIATTTDPSFTNYIEKVTAGAAVNGFTIMKRKLCIERPEFATLEASGYDWWIGATKNPVVGGDGDRMHILGTVEGGGAGQMWFAVFDGVTVSTIETADFRGTSKAYVLNTSSDSVLGASEAGFSGVGPQVEISGLSGRVYVSASGNATFVDDNLGLLAGSGTITVLNNLGQYERTILIPRYSTSGQYTVVNIAWAGDKLYATCQEGNNTSRADIRIYNDSGVELSYSPFSVYPFGVANDAFSSAARPGKLYLLNAYGNNVMVFNDGGSKTYEVTALPFYGKSLFLLGNGGFVVSGGNQVILFNSSNDMVALLTPEASEAGCSPTWAVDEPRRGRVYIAQNINTSATHIWQINYGAATPTVEAIIDVSYGFGYFAIDNDNARLYVPLPSTGGPDSGAIDVVDTVSGTINSSTAEGMPVSCAFANSKLYVSDVGYSSGDVWKDLGTPPEVFGHKVRVYSLAAIPLPKTKEIDVGYAPTFLKAKGSQIAVLCTGIPAIFIDFAGSYLSFESTAAPTVTGVKMNGIPFGDHTSARQADNKLTAHLEDNTAILGGRVLIDGIERAVTFNPALPENASSEISCFINYLSAGVHSMTIEASDGAQSGRWQAFDISVSAEGRLAIKGNYPLAYPAVFKPMTGTADERTLRIAYELTTDGPITVAIVDIGGRAVYTRKFSAGTMGGRTGYNEVLWDGRSDTGGVLGNGIYPYKVMSKGKVLGTGKIVVYD